MKQTGIVLEEQKVKTETKKDWAESYINTMERFTSPHKGYFLKCFNIQDLSDSKPSSFASETRIPNSCNGVFCPCFTEGVNRFGSCILYSQPRCIRDALHVSALCSCQYCTVSSSKALCVEQAQLAQSRKIVIFFFLIYISIPDRVLIRNIITIVSVSLTASPKGTNNFLLFSNSLLNKESKQR